MSEEKRLSKSPYILHQVIYATPNTRDFEGKPSFWVKHGVALGLALALAVHGVFWGYHAYRYFIAPFEVDVVDQEYEVDWVTLNDPRFKPLANPESGFQAPEKVAELEEAKRKAEEERKRREREAAKRKAEDEKRKAEQAAKKDKAEKDGQTADNKDNKPAEAEKSKPPTGELRFGQVNVAPIKAIVTKLYQLNDSGKLDIENKTFSITLVFRVEPSGRLSGIRIAKSSGIPEIDEAALNIANAVSASQALSPLSNLSSTSLTLDCGDKFTTLRIGGFASSPEQATGLELLINAGLTLAPRNQPGVGAMVSNTRVKADGKRLTATVQMTRSQLNALLKNNFKKG
jgi:hypothetical protein